MGGVGKIFAQIGEEVGRVPTRGVAPVFQFQLIILLNVSRCGRGRRKFFPFSQAGSGVAKQNVLRPRSWREGGI